MLMLEVSLLSIDCPKIRKSKDQQHQPMVNLLWTPYKKCFYDAPVVIKAVLNPMTAAIGKLEGELRPAPLSSPNFKTINEEKYKFRLSWVENMPIKVRPAENPTRLFILLNHEGNCGGIFISSLLLYASTYDHKRCIGKLLDSFSSEEKIKSLFLPIVIDGKKSSRTLGELLLDVKNPTKHSKDSLQFHEYEAWHCCKSANQYVVVARKKGSIPPSIKPLHHSPTGKVGHLFNALLDFILPKIFPILLQSYMELPEEIRPRDARRSGFGIRGLPFTYIGLNICPSLEFGAGNGMTFAGTFDPVKGHHYGIHVHRDKNNSLGKVGAIFTLGSFQGFSQHLLPYGVEIECPNGGLLWADTSDLMHAVGKGTGFRISIVFCNHHWFDFGFRRCDGGTVDDSVTTVR